MKFKLKPLSSSAFIFIFCCFYLSFLVNRSEAQAKLDPIEAKALNSIFQKWDIKAVGLWNLSGEPCSGAAINDTDFTDGAFNPGIECDCAANNGTTCHIINLKAYSLDIKGEIPEELQNLTHLTGLNLAQNVLTGPLPPFLGNLSEMQYLSLSLNAFYGPIPEELGNLKNLIQLALSSNNLSGTLPPQLGNLLNLQEIYIDSAGVSGEIPSTFSNLRKVKTVMASDNQFTGTIPDFIGNWTELTTLRFEGNSFEGPIPSSFSQLTLLNDLRISDLKNVSSSLDFTKNMTALTVLVLRNSMISGTIPTNMEAYQQLQRLDLSFNNLTGAIPNSLFNLNSLSHLFLGNNSLTGDLPTNKSATLLYIDLSYNELSGSFPSWVTPNLQLNIVANNFDAESLNKSGLPSDLYCLQRNFSCNRESAPYSRFAIKCGGPTLTSSRDIEFEADNSTFSPASYNITDSKRWAVSNVGLFAERANALYIERTQKQITGTLDAELFQTARISPTSLRYYGLGLENGIYNVNLQFIEIGYDDRSSGTWQSLGRRVFDIYLQGNRMIKDFDIRKEANGSSFKVVEENLKAEVTMNYLEIHLLWAGKGTCCIPVQGYYGPSISAISVTPDFTPKTPDLPPTSETQEKKNKTGLIVGTVVGGGVLFLVSILAVLFLRRRRSRNQEDEELLEIGSATTFTYSELRTSTEDFNPANKLGEGGFGPVYKGKLLDGRVVAVKQLSVASKQGKSQFIAEIAAISAVQHRNLVKLYGCCIEGDKRLLVYEYLENKSLDQALFGKSSLHLDWPTRFNICLGTAKGLAYLHEDSKPRIVHRDVKASNILLDKDLNPKISDFGLAKLYDDKKTHISTRVAGTIGYLAPEYAMRGHLTEKADVFGFGIVILEILSGRTNSDSSLDSEKIYLLEWAWSLHENNHELELVDPTLTEFDKEEAIRMIGVALLCSQASPSLRPSMSRALMMLTGATEVSEVTTKPGYLVDWQFNDLSGLMSSNDSGFGSLTSTTTGSLVNTSSSNESKLTQILEVDTSNSPNNVTQPMLH